MDAYISNLGNWKRTSRKVHELWVCMPKESRIITNRLTGRSQRTTIDECFVLSGVRGELRAISYLELSRNYTFEDGKKITSDSIKNRTVNGVMDWQKVRAMAGGVYKYALLLPVGVYRDFSITLADGSVTVANVSGIDHCEGDYLVCKEKNGAPDINHVELINGTVFPATFNLRFIKATDRQKEIANITPERPRGIIQKASGSARESAGGKIEQSGGSRAEVEFGRWAAKIFDCIKVKKNNVEYNCTKGTFMAAGTLEMLAKGVYLQATVGVSPATAKSGIRAIFSVNVVGEEGSMLPGRHNLLGERVTAEKQNSLDMAGVMGKLYSKVDVLVNRIGKLRFKEVITFKLVEIYNKATEKHVEVRKNKFSDKADGIITESFYSDNVLGKSRFGNLIYATVPSLPEGEIDLRECMIALELSEEGLSKGAIDFRIEAKEKFVAANQKVMPLRVDVVDIKLSELCSKRTATLVKDVITPRYKLTCNEVLEYPDGREYVVFDKRSNAIGTYTKSDILEKYKELTKGWDWNSWYVSGMGNIAIIDGKEICVNESEVEIRKAERNNADISDEQSWFDSVSDISKPERGDTERSLQEQESTKRLGKYNNLMATIASNLGYRGAVGAPLKHDINYEAGYNVALKMFDIDDEKYLALEITWEQDWEEYNAGSPIPIKGTYRIRYVLNELNQVDAILESNPNWECSDISLEKLLKKLVELSKETGDICGKYYDTISEEDREVLAMDMAFTKMAEETAKYCGATVGDIKNPVMNVRTETGYRAVYEGMLLYEDTDRKLRYQLMLQVGALFEHGAYYNLEIWERAEDGTHRVIGCCHSISGVGGEIKSYKDLDSHMLYYVLSRYNQEDTALRRYYAEAHKSDGYVSYAHNENTKYTGFDFAIALRSLSECYAADDVIVCNSTGERLCREDWGLRIKKDAPTINWLIEQLSTGTEAYMFRNPKREQIMKRQFEVLDDAANKIAELLGVEDASQRYREKLRRTGERLEVVMPITPCKNSDKSKCLIVGAWKQDVYKVVGVCYFMIAILEEVSTDERNKTKFIKYASMSDYFGGLLFKADSKQYEDDESGYGLEVALSSVMESSGLYTGIPVGFEKNLHDTDWYKHNFSRGEIVFNGLGELLSNYRILNSVDITDDYIDVKMEFGRLDGYGIVTLVVRVTANEEMSDRNFKVESAVYMITGEDKVLVEEIASEVVWRRTEYGINELYEAVVKVAGITGRRSGVRPFYMATEDLYVEGNDTTEHRHNKLGFDREV